MLQIKHKLIRYGAKFKIAASANTFEELIGSDDTSFGPHTMARYAALVPVSKYSDKYLYVRARAISGYEKHGANDNGDAFEWDELLHSYPTFVRGGVYKDHQNDQRENAVGIIIDAWPNIEEEYIEVLMAVNRKKAPNEVRMIEAGNLTDVSMGCVVDAAICSVCGNVAQDEEEYCTHIQGGLKGIEVLNKQGTKVPCFEYNRGVRFFETSLISPYSEGADPAAKIKETIAGKVTSDVAFEDYVLTPLDEGDNVDMSFEYGQFVITKEGSRGVVARATDEVVFVVLEDGNGESQRFDPASLSIESPQTNVLEVTQMAKKREEDLPARTAEGAPVEEFDADHPNRANPMITKERGDYGNPAEKFKQDFDRTNVASDDTDPRGLQMSTMKERGDYPHKGYTGDKTEGKAPIGTTSVKTAVAELELDFEDAIADLAGQHIELEQVKEVEAKKAGVLSKFKTLITGDAQKEAAAEEFGADNPDHGNPMSMEDPENYNEAAVYSDAQKANADGSDAESRTDFAAQRPHNYSNTPEEISKLRSVASAKTDEVLELIKKHITDEKEQEEFIDIVTKLKAEDLTELQENVDKLKGEEDAEVDKEVDKEEKKDKPDGPPAPKPAGPPAPKPGAPKPGAPKPPVPGMPPVPGKPAGPPKPLAPPPPPRPPVGPAGLPMRTMIRLQVRQRLVTAALDEWGGGEDLVSKAYTMIMGQMSRDITSNPDTLLTLAAEVNGLDADQVAALRARLEMPDETSLPKAASKIVGASSVDYASMSTKELHGVYGYLKQVGADADTMNAILTAMVERGSVDKTAAPQRIAASKKEALDWVVQQMTSGGMTFKQAWSQAEAKFEIADADMRTIDERPLAFGHETEGPGDSSEMRDGEPSDGNTLSSGTPGQPNLWAGVRSREYDERNSKKVAPKQRTAAGELNDYDLTFGTNVRWNTDTTKQSAEENATQKKDFAGELKEASKKLTAAFDAGKISSKFFVAKMAELSKMAVDDYTGPAEITTDAKGAPSTGLAEDANKEQKSEFAAEVKECVGLKLGQKIKVVVGASDESHEATITEINTDHDIIHVDYADLRNRDAIDLREGKSKVLSSVRVYAKASVLAVKQGTWHGILTAGSQWSIYNFAIKKDRSKVAVVDLADVLERKAEDATVEEVTESFNTVEYGDEILTNMAGMEAEGKFEQTSPTGLAPEEVSLDEITEGSSVRIADDWLPTDGESTELMHDVVQLRDEKIIGEVEVFNPITQEAQVSFGPQQSLLFATAELTLVATDANATGTDVRWTAESKEISDAENRTQDQEFKKEQAMSAFGPDTAHNTHLAHRTAAGDPEFTEEVSFMGALIEDGELTKEDAIQHVASVFEMTAETSEAFEASQAVVNMLEETANEVFANEGTDPEFGKGKEVTQMRKHAALRKNYAARIAHDMLDKGMVEGITADSDDADIKEAVDSQIDELLKMDDDGLYVMEGAVKSASDPSGDAGIEALRKKASKVGPTKGTLQNPVIMRGAQRTPDNSLDDPEFFT